MRCTVVIAGVVIKQPIMSVGKERNAIRLLGLHKSHKLECLVLDNKGIFIISRNTTQQDTLLLCMKGRGQECAIPLKMWRIPDFSLCSCTQCSLAPMQAPLHQGRRKTLDTYAPKAFCLHSSEGLDSFSVTAILYCNLTISVWV